MGSGRPPPTPGSAKNPGAGFHSISFPSEWGEKRLYAPGGAFHCSGFHSISFPSEWGVYHAPKLIAFFGVVSIQLVSPASGEMIWCRSQSMNLLRFHSISFPSEWGDVYLRDRSPDRSRQVSIQLVSPASGEDSLADGWQTSFIAKSFHSISFPSEWGDFVITNLLPLPVMGGFHSISFPSEWGVAKPVE